MAGVGGVAQLLSVRRHRAPEIYKAMKTDITFTEIRAGVISSLVLAIGYLYLTGLSSQLHLWAFMVLVAVCLVLILKSVVDLLVWPFFLTTAFSGSGFGKAARLIRSL